MTRQDEAIYRQELMESGMTKEEIEIAIEEEKQMERTKPKSKTKKAPVPYQVLHKKS